MKAGEASESFCSWYFLDRISLMWLPGSCQSMAFVDSQACCGFFYFFFVVWANLWHVSQDSQNSYWHEILLVLTDTSPLTFLSSWIIFVDCGQNLLTSELWPLTHTRRVEPPASVSGVK